MFLEQNLHSSDGIPVFSPLICEQTQSPLVQKKYPGSRKRSRDHSKSKRTKDISEANPQLQLNNLYLHYELKNIAYQQQFDHQSSTAYDMFLGEGTRP
jgi:hypothetical protein